MARDQQPQLICHRTGSPEAIGCVIAAILPIAIRMQLESAMAQPVFLSGFADQPGESDLLEVRRRRALAMGDRAGSRSD